MMTEIRNRQAALATETLDILGRQKVACQAAVLAQALNVRACEKTIHFSSMTARSVSRQEDAYEYPYS